MPAAGPAQRRLALGSAAPCGGGWPVQVRLEGRRQVSSAAVTGEASSAPREVDLAVQGMTCAACAARVEKKLNAIDGVCATVNFATERATVTAPASVPVQQLIDAVEQAGYGAEVLAPRRAGGPGGAGPAGAAGGGPDADRVSYLKKRLIVALVFFVPLSDLSVLLSLFPSFRFPGWQWVLVLLAAPVVVWAAWPFHAGRAAERPARVGVDGHAGVAGHHRGVRLVGVCDVRPGPRPGPGERGVSAAARLRRRHLPGGRRVGDDVPAGGPAV